MTSDPIADLLIRIKNAYMAKLKVVEVPHSNVKEALTKVLEKYGYVGEMEKLNAHTFKVKLVYTHGSPAVTDVKRISKPGLRRYVKYKDLFRLQRGGLGHIILSTPKGLKTHFEAKKEGVGGEILCRIW